MGRELQLDDDENFSSEESDYYNGSDADSMYMADNESKFQPFQKCYIRMPRIDDTTLFSPSSSTMSISENVSGQVSSSSASDESEEEEEEIIDSWTDITENDVDNFVHSFSFSERPGPKHCPPVSSQPIDYFTLFFTEALINMIVLETNNYALLNISEDGENASPFRRLQTWYSVTALEIKAFIAVILNMGLTRKPTIRSYWSIDSSQSTPWFAKMFSRYRFETILKFFSLINNKALGKSSYKNLESDVNQNIQPLVDHCNRLFKYFYTAHQQLSINEYLVGNENQSTIIHCIPKTHYPWDLKFGVLRDAVSNYCMSMVCFNSKKYREEIKIFGLAYIVVGKLLSFCSYLNKGYHIFTNYIFTNVTLLKMLYKKKTFMTGTVSKDMKGLPSDIKAELNAGQKVYFKQDNIVALAYRQDKSHESILMLSSMPVVKDFKCTKKRQGITTVETKPAMILDYSKYMEGNDNFDTMLFAHLDHCPTATYWKKVVFKLFATMVLNAYVIYKENNLLNNKKPLSSYQFLVSIITSIENEWLGEQQRDNICNDGDNQNTFGLEKLPGRKERTCGVCSVGGPRINQSRKRSRTVCVRCKKGCHGICFSKHKCT